MNGRSAFYALLAAALAFGAARAQDTTDAEPGAGGDSAEGAGASVLEDEDLARRLDELVAEADAALETLLQENETAADLMERAYGHAVINTTKGGLLLTGAGGTGVARAHDTGETVYMRLAQAGIGLGAGFQNYTLVLLIGDEETFRRFTSGQWDGSLSAQATAGTEGASTEEQFLEGVRAFRITDGGLMAQLDVTGLRVWPARRLNDAATLREARLAAAGRARQDAAVADAGSPAETPDDAQAEAQPEPEAAEPEAETQTAGLDALAAEHEDLQIFVEAVRAAGLEDALTGDTPYTVFAPTDDAFESMSGMTREELLSPENRDELVDLLRAHIVADDVDAQQARSLRQARTIDGDLVTIQADGERLTVGEARVLEPDIRSGNLRIYAVDRPITERPATRLAVAEDEPAQSAPDDSAPDDDEPAETEN